ncbi:MAG: hypothetical protein AAB512_03920 [Patescibacteria group bacterium]
MTQILKTTFLHLIILLAASLVLLFLAKSTHAQTPTEDVTTKYGITFPISEIGSCTDYASCRNFCDDPVNLTTCNEFAKKKGFYKEDKPLTEGKFVDAAKTDLGCDSAQSCKQVCQKQENFEKCSNFAKKLQISGGYVRSPADVKVLEKAKEALGCDSAGSCANFCQQEGNHQKCADFARESGLRGGEQVRGPGGCATEGTCRAYCLDPANFNECSKFAPPTQIGKFKGPGGCDSPGSCREYCEQNPAGCRNYAPGSNGRYVPVACPQGQFFGPGGACTHQEKSQDAANCVKDGKFWSETGCEDHPPIGIASVGQTVFSQRPDMGNCSTPGSCYDWCKANPGKCGGFNPDFQRPNDTFIVPAPVYGGPPPVYLPKPDMGGCTTPGSCYDWCKEHPGQCGGFNPDYQRPNDNYNQGSSGSYQPQPNPNMGNCTTASSCYDWCKANPGRCSGFNPNNPRPVDPIYTNQSSSGSTQSTTGTTNTTSNTTQGNPTMGGCTTGASCYDWCKAHPGQCGGFNPDSPRPPEYNNQTQSSYTPMPYTPPSTSQPAPQPAEQPQQPQPTTSTTPVMGVKTSVLDSIFSFFTSLFR